MKINYADSNLNREKCIMGNVGNVEDLLSKINEIKSKKDRMHYVCSGVCTGTVEGE